MFCLCKISGSASVIPRESRDEQHKVKIDDDGTMVSLDMDVVSLPLSLSRNLSIHTDKTRTGQQFVLAHQSHH